VKPGIFKAVVSDWGVGKAESTGNVSTNVQFTLPETNERVTWKGYLTEKTKEGTIKTLFKLGFNGNLDSFGEGVSSGCLEVGKEAMVTIEEEKYKNKDGEEKTAFKVRWVNLPGEHSGMKRLENAEASSLLASFKADFLEQKKVFDKENPEGSEDIPF